MRLVFINRFFHPDHSATSQLLSDLVFALSDAGTDVHVVTSRLLYDNPRTQLAAEERISGVHVHRVWTSRLGRHTTLRRILDYLTFYPSVFFCLLKLLRPGDVAVAKTDPPLISVPVWIAAWLRGATLINWLQDVFPEVASAVGMRGMGGAAGQLLAWLRDKTLKRAAANVVLSRRTAAALVQRGIPHDRLSVIPNWADGKAIRPLPASDNPLRTEWNFTGKFVAGYSGNLGRVHEFNTMLDAAELLKDEPAIMFLFVGSGQKHAQLQTEATKRGLSNIVFKPYQPRDKLNHSITVPDVHLVSLLPALEGYIVPSKLYGALAAGRPVLFIGARDGVVAEEIARFRCGSTVELGAAKNLAECVRRLHREPALAEEMGRNARIAFDQNFDKVHAMSKWRAVLADARCMSGKGLSARVP